MKELIYHGSPFVVEKPDLARCRPRNDYGQAFYCTFDKDLASEWACEDAVTGGYVNEYAVDLAGLFVLDLNEDPRGVLAWIAVLLAHRTLDREWNIADDAMRFIAKYGVDLDDYDVVMGYRADDSYFSIARAFVSGSITDVQLAEALRLGELGRQVAFRTSRALEALEFRGAARVDPGVWGSRRTRRDRQARKAFAQMKKSVPAQGKRIFELGGDM